jgi:hypothetical protein
MSLRYSGYGPHLKNLTKLDVRTDGQYINVLLVAIKKKKQTKKKPQKPTKKTPTKNNKETTKQSKNIIQSSNILVSKKDHVSVNVIKF